MKWIANWRREVGHKGWTAMEGGRVGKVDCYLGKGEREVEWTSNWQGEFRAAVISCHQAGRQRAGVHKQTNRGGGGVNF